MKLDSISAHLHIFEGQANGKPSQLLLKFESGRSIRMRVTGDGERMIVDEGVLEEPVDMDEFGRMDVADVTLSLFPKLRGRVLTDIRALVLNGRRVGLKLNGLQGDAFYFWVDSDDLHWGDEGVFANHDWLDDMAPVPSEHIEF